MFCRPPTNSGGVEGEIPLIAVLRDTLGDANPNNDRLTYVWLLTYAPPNLEQRFLSAIPFFYWRVGDGPDVTRPRDTKPLLNLAAPEHPVFSDGMRDLLQWTLLDPSTTPIRATSRAYRTNDIDHERLHLEEAVSYLRLAPVSDDAAGLTRTQIYTVIARLELRKKMLGGFVNEHQAARLGEEADYQQERVRARNWELLRQCAEKTGLVFEPLSVGGTDGQYAMLWFPVKEASEPLGTSLGPVWKLLNISDPWRDGRLEDWRGPVFHRKMDDNGTLLPAGAPGGERVDLLPLGVYSLNYPKLPLLLVDFRDKLHVRWHEMTQRSINEITAGVIGLSHFTNWYYYVGADLYNFVVARHGTAVEQSARLDCYSQFRVQLALDHQLDPVLRKEMRERIKVLEINPLEANPALELQAAHARYEQLEKDARPDGVLVLRLDKDRREELASFGETKKQLARDGALHMVTLGAYTHRTPREGEELAMLDSYRRAQYQLNFLDSLVNAATEPEVSYESARIESSVAELAGLMPYVNSPAMRVHAGATLQKLEGLSHDTTLRAGCVEALNSIQRNSAPAQPGAAPGVSAGAAGAGVAFHISGADGPK
ncbi:MAG: hypothetical protein JOY54_21215 [Acidobacteriaceae bacterium]|nr:hypothetical protein [Acidobacteriaceae bacterium]